MDVFVLIHVISIRSVNTEETDSCPTITFILFVALDCSKLLIFTDNR